MSPLNGASAPEDTTELTDEQAEALVQDFMDRAMLCAIKRAGGVLRLPFDELGHARGGFHSELEDEAMVLYLEGANPRMPTLSDENLLLRSMYQIALRQGKETNWHALTGRLKMILCRHAGANPSNAEQVDAATMTLASFRDRG